MRKTNAPYEIQAYLNTLPEVLHDWRVPGMAVGIIKDNKILFANGFGNKSISQNDNVNKDTLFAIGSTTKAFTSTLLGILVDQGQINWDDPVINYIRDFRLMDPIATTSINIRDLLCHRSGLPRHDLFHFLSDLTRIEIIQRLRYLPPFTSFRSRFEYNNLMYVTAGLVIENVTGQSWEKNIQKFIFDPLSMNDSNTSIYEVLNAKNAAKPHSIRNGRLSQINFRNIDSIGPAGSINSSINDVLKWLKVWLNQGKYDKGCLLSKYSINEILAPHIPIPENDRETLDLKRYPELGFYAYALGWGMHSYRGHLMFQHGGSIDGFKVYFIVSPAEQFAVAILNNSDHSNLRYAVALDIVDRLLQLEPIPWLQRVRESGTDITGTFQYPENMNDEFSKEEFYIQFPLSAYAGQYEHPAYGVLSIKITEGILMGTYNNIPVNLKQIYENRFQLNFESDTAFIRNIEVEFSLPVDGKSNIAFIPFEPMTAPIPFISDKTSL